ncbi:MAG: porphobilinogen deaminase [Rickettsiaceae bacterium]|jgi:hydroxymethylbilane synthase|nr:porphobilinogen deaminase [Rickettsiaceae bacterium]
MKEIEKIRIGTRGSKLALAQAYLVENALLAAHKNLKTEIVTITTTGDKILDKNLNEIGGKGLFIKEIEEALLANSIDIAVHSMKDMTAFIADEFAIPCILKREDSRDVLISKKAKTIRDLPLNAVVGTSSPRRASQALNIRPDLKIVPFRGNIQTRIAKLQENEVDATFLAIAGIKRCNIHDDIINIIDENEMLPAVAQGAIGIEILKKRKDLEHLLLPLHDETTYNCVIAERAFLAEFEGSCKTPIAASAKINDNKITANFLIASMDGKQILRTSRQGKVTDAANLGKDAALELKAKTGNNFF